MNRVILPLAIAVLACSGCASKPIGSVETIKGGHTVELLAAGDHSYSWMGQIYSIQALTAALSAQDEKQPIQRIHLLDGDHSTTIADVIDVTILAKELGAASYMQKDGALQLVTFEVKV